MIVSDHNNSCWGTNVPGHRRVWAQSCGPNHVWAQTWWNRVPTVVSNNTVALCAMGSNKS